MEALQLALTTPQHSTRDGTYSVRTVHHEISSLLPMRQMGKGARHALRWVRSPTDSENPSVGQADGGSCHDCSHSHFEVGCVLGKIRIPDSVEDRGAHVLTLATENELRVTSERRFQIDIV